MDFDDIKPGQRFRLTGILERPFFLADETMSGTVEEASRQMVRLKMDEVIPGAEEWDNEIVWTPEDDEVSGLEPGEQHDARRIFLFDAEPLMRVSDSEGGDDFVGAEDEVQGFVEGRLARCLSQGWRLALSHDDEKLLTRRTGDGRPFRTIKIAWALAPPSEPITLPAGATVEIIMAGRMVQIEHRVGRDGERFVRLRGVGFDLDGDEPGVYYFPSEREVEA